MRGRVIKNISNHWTVVGDNNLEYDCLASASFRHQKIIPLVGDLVEFDPNNVYITKIYPRSSKLNRPMVANVDQVIIVISVKEPLLDLYLLDRLLLVVAFNNLSAVICFTKTDLLNSDEQEEYQKIKKYYQKVGYKVVENNHPDKIIALLKNHITVVTGQSGVGKSSLLNILDHNLKLKTNEISHSLGRGKHTTRHTELYVINNGYIVDTPGFSALDIKDIPLEKIRIGFPEIDSMATSCFFRNCIHMKETKCAVLAALNKNDILESRYQHYLSFYKERKDYNEYR